MIGPVTNLAVAYLVDNSISEKVCSVGFMGGQYSTLGMNECLAGDFNFYLDSEAAYIVNKVRIKISVGI